MRFGSVAFQPAYVGQRIWTQGAYVDRVTQQFSLTMSGYATVPARQVNAHRRAVTWAVGPTNTMGTEPTSSGRVTPLFLIKYR